MVEIASPSTAARDRGLKRERYALHGVPEYWVVDPDAAAIEVYRLQADPETPTIATGTLTWQAVPGGPTLTFAVADAFPGPDEP